jgi:hypothetical protein
MPNIVQAQRSRYPKALFFGPYGCGKTRLLATANQDERTAPILLLNFEGGESSIAGSGVDMVRITSWEEYNEAFDYLSRADHPYRSIGIDSITETHIFALFNILENEGDKRRNPNLIEQGDYGTASVQLRRLIREFRDLPLGLFVTALEREETDAREGLVKKPALSGRLADEIPGIVDVVGYLTVANDENNAPVRVMLIQNYPKIRVKVRVPFGVEAPNHLINPSIPDLLDALQYEPFVKGE